MGEAPRAVLVLMVAGTCRVLLIEVTRILTLVENSLLIGLRRCNTLTGKVDDRGITTLVTARERPIDTLRNGSASPALSVWCLERTATDCYHRHYHYNRKYS